MTIRMPVVDIPISDEKFRRFAELFERYSDKLEKTPGVWRKVDQQFRQNTAAMLAQNHVMKEFSGEKLHRTEKLWHSIAGASRSTLGNVLAISRTLIKWGALLGGGLVGGGLFGIDRMAGDLSASRFNYMGLGMRYGSWRSFGINMSRFTDPAAFLSSINQAVSNPALQGPLYALGVNPNGSTEQVSLSMLRAMRRLALNTPRGELGLMSQAYGLGPFGGLETLMRLRSMSASEFYKQLEREQKDKSGLGLPPGVARKWQDFTTQMDRAKATIFKTFVQGLVPLEQPLQHLSVAFSGFLSKLMTGPQIKEGIDNLARLLNSFSGDILSKRFQTAVTTLVSDTGTIAGAFHTLAQIIRDKGSPGKAVTDVLGQSPRSAGESFGEYFRNLFVMPSDYRRYLATLDKKYGLQAGTLERTWQTESGGDFNAVNRKTGAAGPFQFMPATAAAFHVDPFNPGRVADAAGAYLSQLRAHYHGNMQEALAAYNWGQGHMDSLMKRYGANWRAHLPKGVRAYVSAISPDSSIVVTARHKTGGNPVLTAAGLAGVPQ